MTRSYITPRTTRQQAAFVGVWLGIAAVSIGFWIGVFILAFTLMDQR